MDGELREAAALYSSSLADVAVALAEDPDSSELQQVHAELAAALAAATSALEDLQQLEPAPAQLNGVAATEEPDVEGGQSAQAALAIAASLSVPRQRVAGASNNARIHPRSLYAAAEPDFAALAVQYPALRQYLLPARGSGSGKGRAVLDFGDPAACRELTRVLLKHDFGIEWWVPEGQLVPPVTNRANYIHWLQDLLELSRPAPDPEFLPGSSDRLESSSLQATAAAGAPAGTAKGTNAAAGSAVGAAAAVVGLDIGCGANLIYPLLGAALCGWRFVGVDVTDEALEWARRNRGLNPRLAPLIEVRRAAMQPSQAEMFGAGAGAGGRNGVASPSPGPAGASGAAAADDAAAAAPAGIISGALRPGERFAFCMCNPPFFGSMAEAGLNPATAYGGTPQEMVYPGGELAFVGALVADSAALRGRVHWFSTMVGKKATLRTARTALYRAGVKVVRTTEFFQGKTSRWGLAWSFAADPEAANKPLPRFPAAGTAPAAPAAGGEAPQPPNSLRKLGRSLSVQVAAPAVASGEILATVEASLRQQGLECTADKAAFTLRASTAPEDGAPAPKRAKHDDEAGAPPAAAAWACVLRLFMQHPGSFMLTASMGKGAADAAVRQFNEAFHQVQAAVRLRWKVT